MFKGLTTGDILIRSNGFLADHYGLFLGTVNGQEMVAENTPATGIRLVPFEQFMAGKKLLGTIKFDGCASDQAKVLSCVQQLLGQQYDLFRFNCEHFQGTAIPAEPVMPFTFKPLLNNRSLHRSTRYITLKLQRQIQTALRFRTPARKRLLPSS